MLKFVGLPCLVLASLMGWLALVPVFAQSSVPDLSPAPRAGGSTEKPVRVSPYVIAARQRALAASEAAHAPVVSPMMRYAHQAIGQVQQH
jgi:hypothetical protein